jgi:rhamnulokinase
VTVDAVRLLAFDLGAESGRAVLGEFTGDRLAIREVARFPNGPVAVGRRLCWDAPRLFREIAAALAAVAGEGIAPAAVGVDAWGVDFGLLDGNGDLVGPPVCYRDRRTEGALAWLFERVPRDRVYERTGIQVLPINTLAQLAAMARDGDPDAARARALLFVPDLVHHFLTGLRRTEFTIATTSQLLDAATGDWDDELLAAVGVPRSWMQEIVPPGTVLGVLTQGLRRATGWRGGPVVAVATHDTASAVVAAPLEGDDAAYISSGTWSLVGVESPRPIVTDAARRANLTNEGGVGAFRVLKNVTGLWLLQECRRAWSRGRATSYDELVEAAEAAPPLAALVDPGDPSFLAPADMPEAIRVFCVRTGQRPPETPGAVARCILESLALAYDAVIGEIARVTGRRVSRVHVIGGGARNRLLSQLTADATGLPVLAGPVEATAIGNLGVQAMALGRLASVGELRRMVGASFPAPRFEPRPSPEWDAARQRFRSIRGNGGRR